MAPDDPQKLQSTLPGRVGAGRCQARMRKHAGRQCGQRAVAGKKYCKYHGGRQPPIYWKHRLGKSMAGFYSKSLGPTLHGRVKELAGLPLTQQSNILEEIQVARAVAMDAIQLASVVLDESNRDKVTDQDRVLATRCVMDSMNQISILVERLAKIEALSEDKLSLKAVDAFVLQITRIIGEELGHTHVNIAERINARILNDIRIPLDAMKGNTAGADKLGAAPLQINLQDAPEEGNGEGS